MGRIVDLMNDYPLVVVVGIAICSILAVLHMYIEGSKMKTPKMGSPAEAEEDDKPDMTLIKILDREGKVIEEVTVETDSINYDYSPSSYLSYENAEGKEVVYLLGTYSAKMTDL